MFIPASFIGCGDSKQPGREFIEELCWQKFVEPGDLDAAMLLIFTVGRMSEAETAGSHINRLWKFSSGQTVVAPCFIVRKITTNIFEFS